MNDSCNVSVTMAADTKKYGIRIHKALFRQLGEPRYIQLLVNPDEGVVAIQTVDKKCRAVKPTASLRRGCIRKIPMKSTADLFIRKLREVEPRIEDGGAYRLTGSMIPSLKVAVFSLKTLQRMDRQE